MYFTFGISRKRGLRDKNVAMLLISQQHVDEPILLYDVSYDPMYYVCGGCIVIPVSEHRVVRSMYIMCVSREGFMHLGILP